MTFTLAIASGKGGTGKTLVATNLAVLAARKGERVILVDCDAEAPNDHLFLPLSIVGTTPVEVSYAEVDPGLCETCGACRDVCAYGAPRLLGSSAFVFTELCHACGLCVHVCPTGAMRESLHSVGEVTTATTGIGGLTLVSGALSVGEVRTPTVIRKARSSANLIEADLVILDAPPGVSCSAVASVRAADALLLVTEPTVFGLHDLDLAQQLGRELQIPMWVLINRAGDCSEVLACCDQWDIPVVAVLPFDRRIAASYAAGRLAVETVEEIIPALERALDAMRPTTPTAEARHSIAGGDR
ncbi:MAG: nucleotide-binding protein [Thermoleophilia bacterium]